MNIYGIEKDGTEESICRAGIEMQTWRMDLRTWQGKEAVGQVEGIALTYIHYRA